MVWQQAVTQGITAAMTTPYGGGEWEIEQHSLLTPEQQAVFDALAADPSERFKVTTAEGVDIAGSLTQADAERLSISALDRVRENQALSVFENFMNTQANQDRIDTRTELAKREAVEGAEAINLNFAGRGSSSSASNRARGRVQSDLAANIAEIMASEEEKAQQLRLAGAQGYGNLATQMTGQDLTRNIANRDTQLAIAEMIQGRDIAQAQADLQVNIANAAATNQMTAAEAEFLLNLATAQTTENIAIQTPDKTLHKDLWGGLKGGNIFSELHKQGGAGAKSLGSLFR